MSFKLRGLHENVRPAAEKCLAWADHFGVPVTVTSVYRSLEDQRVLRERFETCVELDLWRPDLPPRQRHEGCRFPANEPGDSAHNFRLAWDSTVPTQFQSWWNYLRRFFGWEVLEHDQIHAQVPGWRRFVQ